MSDSAFLNFMMGHWFHPVDDLRAVAGDASIWVLIAVTVVLTAVGLILGFSRKYKVPAWPWVLGGVIAGSVLWPVHVVA